MAGRSLAQRAMQNPVLATVYEKAWRPVLGFTLMGFDLDHVLHEKDLTIQTLRLAPGDLVLDLACGPGSFTSAFATQVGDDGLAVGVDFSEPMLHRALRDNADTGASYVRGDGTRLPFADGAFDAVSCYAALYLIPEPFAVVAEMVRVLRPGGRIAIMASRASARAAVRPVQARVLGLSGLTMFDTDAFTEVLRQAGFTDIEQEIHGFAQYVAATAP